MAVFPAPEFAGALLALRVVGSSIAAHGSPGSSGGWAGKSSEKVMIVECAWCGAHLGEKEPIVDPRPTSGICDECIEQLESGQTCAAPRLRSSLPRARSQSAAPVARAVALGNVSMINGLNDMPTVRLRRGR
jgi:hypothetical protein